MRSVLFLSLSLATFGAFAACATDDPISPDTVVGIPPGSGRGTATSGAYTAQFDTTACTGTCQAPLSICKVGDVGGGQVMAVQHDGALAIDAVGGTLSGGIDRDGSFRVGAVVPFHGLQNAARWDGDSDAATMTGTMQMHVTGNYQGTAIDCTTVATVSANRAR